MATGSERERRVIFGEDAEAYDQGRPTYPTELIDDLVDLVGADAQVVDVGTGTAKSTRLLAARGMTGVGVEADPDMAVVARRHLADYPGWRVDVSDFEAWTPTDGDSPADLVSSAQAWHWVRPSAGLRKAHGLLRPGGWMAVWWNLADDDRSALRQEIDAWYEEAAPGELFGPSVRWGEKDGSPFHPRPDSPGYDRDDDYPQFGEPLMRLYRWTLTYTTDELITLVQTHSNHRLLPPDQLDRLTAGLRRLVDGHGGTYDYPYVTRMWAAQRT